MKFEKPPLIELIAEFRWIPVNAFGQEVNNPTALFQSGPDTEKFYDSFRRAIITSGYTVSERLIPSNFAHPMHQPVFRYSRGEEETSRTVMQVGVGLMSVHALPPYENWSAFRPVIEMGLNALSLSRITRKANRVFTNISLRYIDAFNPVLRGGRSERKFLSEVLQVNVETPVALNEMSADPDATEISVQIKSRTKSGLDMTLSIGPNVDPGDPHRIIMDTTVSSPESVPDDLASTLDVLERAHTSIRTLFVGMTKPIHELMVPLNGESDR